MQYMFKMLILYYIIFVANQSKSNFKPEYKKDIVCMLHLHMEAALLFKY